MGTETLVHLVCPVIFFYHLYYILLLHTSESTCTKNIQDLGSASPTHNNWTSDQCSIWFQTKTTNHRFKQSQIINLQTSSIISPGTPRMYLSKSSLLGNRFMYIYISSPIKINEKDRIHDIYIRTVHRYFTIISFHSLTCCFLHTFYVYHRTEKPHRWDWHIGDGGCGQIQVLQLRHLRPDSANCHNKFQRVYMYIPWKSKTVKINVPWIC